MASEREGAMDAAFLQGIHPIRDVQQLENLGGFYSHAKKHMNQRSISNVVTYRHVREFSDVQSIAIGLTLPFVYDPPSAYPFLKSLITNPKSSSWPSLIRTSLAIRLVRCAVMCDKVEELYKDTIIQERHQAHEHIYQLPLLMLAVHTSHPLTRDVVWTGYQRLDAITYYFSGCNKLLAGKFDLADCDLLHAWELSKAAKDIRRAIIKAMSLSAFLNKKSWEVFKSRLPKKYIPDRDCEFQIWNLDVEFETTGFTNLYDRLKGELREEHKRRVLIDIARVAKVVTLESIQKLCGVSEIQSYVDPKELKVDVREGLVYFHGPNLTPIIDHEIASLTSILRDHPHS